VSSGQDNGVRDEGTAAESGAIKEKSSLEGELSRGGNVSTNDAVSLAFKNSQTLQLCYKTNEIMLPTALRVFLKA
jgi:hypothetical protein